MFGQRLGANGERKASLCPQQPCPPPSLSLSLSTLHNSTIIVQEEQLPFGADPEVQAMLYAGPRITVSLTEPPLYLYTGNEET